MTKEQREYLLQNNPLPPDFKIRKSQGYLGNAEIKRAGIKLPLTEDHIREFIRCRDDIEYFCRRYAKLVHVDKGLIPFNPYPFQVDIMNATIEHRNNAILVSRQAGKTSVISLIVLHYILFNEHKNVAIIANKAATARLILGRIQLMYTKLPKWMQQGVIEWNKGSVSFENGCQIFVGATTAASISGNSISMLIIDEVALIPSNIYEEFFRSVYPTISSGQKTKIFMVSSAKGMNHWYHIVKAAREKKSSFNLLESDWRSVTWRDEKWKENEIKATSLEAFQQEHENHFIGSSKTLLSATCLNRLSFNNPVDTNDEKTLKIYEKVQPDHQYFLTVDVSEGLNQDYSTISVIDVSVIPYKQVATYRSNKISPLLFPLIIYKLGTNYNNGYVLVENNSIGYSVVRDLNYELGYENVLFVKPMEEEKIRLGIRTSNKTKKLGCLRIKDLIESGSLEINDEQTVLEFYNFVENGASYEADDDFHDDMVMGLVNFGYYTSLEAFKEITKSSFKEHFQQIKKQHLEDSFPALPYINTDGGVEVFDPQDDDLQKEFDKSFWDGACPVDPEWWQKAKDKPEDRSEPNFLKPTQPKYN